MQNPEQGKVPTHSQRDTKHNSISELCTLFCGFVTLFWYISAEAGKHHDLGPDRGGGGGEVGRKGLGMLSNAFLPWPF